MSIFAKRTDPDAERTIDSAEALIKAVRAVGIIPFFENPLPGYSIEEMTPAEHWFESDNLGPWDWKIAAVQTGEIAYGKFLCGGKAAFATSSCYRDLMNWRRSLPKYAMKSEDTKAYQAICEAGTLTTRELRMICGLKKAQLDSLLTRLEMQTRIIIGDIERVYKGEFLEYNGWQLASLCRPEDLFEFDMDEAFRSPEESFARLKAQIKKNAQAATDAQIQELLG